MYEDILTKDFLKEQLIDLKKPLIQLSIEINISKITIINRCKKLGIYQEILDSRELYNLKTKNLANKQFGKLKVIEIGKTDKHNKVRWICECECGEKRIINAGSLIRGLSKSCGSCDIPSFTGYENVSGSWIRRLKQGAEKRNLEFSIDAKDVQDLYYKQNGKCALSGVELSLYRGNDKINSLQNASIDRIDNKIGYTLDNIQLIHKRLNRIKCVLNNDELIHWCHLIAQQHPEYVEIENIKDVGWNTNTR